MNQISLDINKSGQIINEPVVLRVGETNQNLTVHIVKNGQPYTAITSATFNAEKPNSSIIANDPANIDGNTLTYTFPKTLNNESGKITKAYFLINKEVSTESFVIVILPGLPLTGEKTIDDYIPGMGELSQIYDEWKDKLAQILNEVRGMDAPTELKNIVENELDKYTQQLSDLQAKIDKAGTDFNSKVDNATKELNDSIDSSNKTLQSNVDATGGRIDGIKSQLDALEVPEFSSRNLLPNTRTLTGLADSKNVTSNGYQNCATVTNPYTDDFPEGSFYNALTVSTINKIPLGDYVITFIAWADNEGDMITNYFYSDDTLTSSSETSQGESGHNGDGAAEVVLTTTPKQYWIKWHNATEGNFQKQIIIGRVLSKFTDGHTNKGPIHVGLPMFVSGNVPTPWQPAPEDKVDVSDLTSLTLNAINGKTLKLKSSDGTETTYTIIGIS